MANNTVSYGFLSLADLYGQRVNTVGVNRVYEAIALNTAEYNRVVNAMMSNWVQRTTVAQEQVELSGSGTLQPIGPDGNPSRPCHLATTPSLTRCGAAAMRGALTAFLVRCLPSKTWTASTRNRNARTRTG